MKRLRIPFLTNGHAPIPFELASALLLSWVGFSLKHVGDITKRYPSNYWIWTFIDEHDLEYLIPWYAVIGSFLICLGLMRVACGCSRGRLLRASGLMVGASLFLFIAVGHLSITFQSIAGAPYLFLAWLFMVIGLFYVRTR